MIKIYKTRGQPPRESNLIPTWVCIPSNHEIMHHRGKYPNYGIHPDNQVQMLVEAILQF